MKSLEEYIFDFCEHKKADLIKLHKNGLWIESVYENMYDFFNGDIPLKYVNELHTNNKSSYIEETLISHDYKKLIEKLKKEFDKNIEYIDLNCDRYKSNETASIVCIVNDIDVFSDERFKRILTFFNYYIHTLFRNSRIAIIEPMYSENVDDYVYSSCHGILYHFTDKKSAESILKNGLRIKRGKSLNLPKRIYCFATDKINLNKVGKEYLKEFIEQVTDKNKILKYGLSIIKIDLKNLYCELLDFYKDTSMWQKEAVFTYNNISAKYLKELEIILE